MHTCHDLAKKVNLGLLMLATVLGAGACAPVDDADAADPAAEEEVAESEQAIGNTYDVGIIPTTTSCPNGGALREIYMDDEDNSNASYVSGWVGATLQGTRFRFCRVDGSGLFPLASASAVNTSSYYAVLKMGSQCPNGSFQFSRYFDNEDNNNQNWTLGDIQPSSQSSGGTTLVFCLFKYATPGGQTMTSFPDFGIPYGVFVDPATNFPLALQQGSVHTDDEDRNNNNGYSASADWIYDAQRIVSGGNNTTLGMARVKVPAWTQWLNRDGPSGVGDYELLGNFVTMGQACPNPLAVQCQTLSGVDWTQTGEVYTCNTTQGGFCVNGSQPDGQCLDYRVRFLCP